MQKTIIIREETMPDNEIKDKQAEATKPAPKPERKPQPPQAENEKPRNKLGLVEILMFLLLAGVVFIFIFGMQQQKRDKELELAMQQKVGELKPIFMDIAKSAKEYKANDPFGDWPLTVDELNIDTTNLKTEEYAFEWLDSGTVVLTTTEKFGKEGVKISYDVEGDSYSIEDPDAGSRPQIKESWFNQ